MHAAQPNDPVYIERLRSTYSQLPLTLTVGIVNYLLTAFILSGVVPTVKLAPWCGGMLLLTIARFLSWHVHRRHQDGGAGQRWGLLAAAGSCLAGSLWGWESFLLFPPEAQYQMFLALVIGGMCAGAATVHAAHLPTALAFVLAATLPLALRCGLDGGRLQLAAAFLILVFGLSLCMITVRYARWFGDTIAVRHDLAQRTSELHEANVRLQNEIAEHEATGALLRQSQKMEAIGLLTAGVAHDFNNLLMSIGGSAALIARRVPPDWPHEPMLTVILQAVDRGALLTRQLLAFGRKQVLMPRPTDLNAMLTGMRRLLDTTVSGQARLVFRLAPGLPPALVDAQQLEHAILNIVINARDAMPSGGEVTIKTMAVAGPLPPPSQLVAHGEFVAIAITDTGTGMSDAIRQQAFDPFFTTKEVGVGSGLGLSQVYGLLHQSGGATDIESTPGHGTTVWLYLPKSQAAADRPAGAASIAPILDGGARLPTDIHILLLDDDQAVRETTAALLADLGYDVTSFGSGPAALEALEGDLPADVALVDLAMPEMPGDQFALLACALRPDLRVIFITGFNDPVLLTEGHHLLLKPFGAATLEAAIRRAVGTGGSVDVQRNLPYRPPQSPEEPIQ